MFPMRVGKLLLLSAACGLIAMASEEYCSLIVDVVGPRDEKLSDILVSVREHDGRVASEYTFVLLWAALFVIVAILAGCAYYVFYSVVISIWYFELHVISFLFVILIPRIMIAQKRGYREFADIFSHSVPSFGKHNLR